MSRPHFQLLLPVVLLLATHANALVPVSPSPLAGTGDTDGPNVLLALSIEFPTAGRAYKGVNTFTNTTEYVGYFDSNLCYRYVTNDTQAGVEYFDPVSQVLSMANRNCGDGYWSGNFLNWAASTSIDIFRTTMTGGTRIVDTTSKTILRLSRHDTRNGGFSLAHNAFLGYAPTLRSSHLISDRYTNMSMSLNRNDSYRLTVRRIYTRNGTSFDQTDDLQLNVRVCVNSPSFPLSQNCNFSYAALPKPEGLIHKYAKTMRVGVLSYLMDDDYNRDGGVLRARLKYPGCYQTVTSNAGRTIALGREWDPVTGIQVANPDPLDASDSGVSNSGVVNYLNRFGEGGYKRYDPAAELYYAGLRYLRNKGNYAAYSNITNVAQKDNFPVLTDWEDPLKSSDQSNFIIYIGDENVHSDVDLPGSAFTGRTLRRPNDDTDLNVASLLDTIRGPNNNNNTIGSSESPGYIASLAYWGNTADIRGDKSGRQNVKAFMIDVVESGFGNTTNNGFYLAAKWGGFTDSNGDNLPSPKAEWSTGVQTAITAFEPDGTPDNYAPANNPAALIRALNRAFTYAALAVKPSLSGLSVSTGNGSVNTGNHVFRTTFERSSANSSDAGADWYGDVEAYKVNLSNNILNNSSLTLDWSTKSLLETQLGATATNRNIYAYNKSTERGITFDTASNYLQTQIGLNANGLAYLRGDNTNAGNNGSKAYRARSYRLGPIELARVGFKGAPEPVAGCSAFSSTVQARPSIYAVPANDGFLHVFNYGDKTASDKGKELFAFMPSAVYPQAAKLAAKDYEYVRLHDGSPVIQDVCLSNTPKTLLIGSSGRGITKADGYGSSSIYAIDVTTPESMNANSVLWEFSSTNDPLLGNMMTLPKLVKLNNGKWAAVVANGINQTASGAGVLLLMLDKAQGAPWELGTNYFKLTVSPDTTPLYSPNGITDVSTYDDDNNGTVDYLYAGDLNGNVWKFDITATDPASWGVALGGQPLFTASQMTNGVPGTRQPITAAPVLMKTAGGQKMVVFGTGINYAETDRATSGQAIYGIMDNNQRIPDPNSLLAQTMPSADSGFSRTSTSTLAANQKGWYIPLTANEQVVSPPFAMNLQRNDMAVVDSIRLRQECAAGGEASFRTVINLSNGAAPEVVLMDTNGDGKTNSRDTRYNRQSLSTGVNYGGSLLLTLPNGRLALCNTGAGGTIECNTIGGTARVVKRVSWRELITD